MKSRSSPDQLKLSGLVASGAGCSAIFASTEARSMGAEKVILMPPSDAAVSPSRGDVLDTCGGGTMVKLQPNGFVDCPPLSPCTPAATTPRNVSPRASGGVGWKTS